jgi:DNA-binding winged helix-turn-helix (wHTH) protein/TolB-like protein/Flp pilus assembly protein TadD
MTAALANSLRFERFVVDIRSACLRRDGTPVPLRPKSFDVLLHLMNNRGRLVTKDELFDQVWADVIVTDNSLVQCIKEIRQALGDDRQTMIETVAKRGYVFTPAVVEIDEGGTPLAIIAKAQQPAAGAVLGKHRVAIAALAGALAVTLLAAGGWWWTSNVRVPAPPPAEVSAADRQAESRLSVAVLPFGVPGETADDYFSVGISDDIATALGRFPDLAVTSPGVVARFRSVGTTADDMQRQLKLQYLVEGSVRRTPERVRIAVRLSDVPRGILLWSESYDASAATVFAIENDITIRIAGALAVKLTNIQQTRLAGQSTVSLEAHDLVLRGRDLQARLSRAAHSQARMMYERAIALDPQYTAAYVGLGRIDLSAIALGWTGDPMAALKRAEDLARKAISLDEFNPAAHVLLGRAYARLNEYERAIDALRRAIALNPSDPDSHAGLGDALLWSGEVKGAIKSLEIATAIDPRLSAEDLFNLGAAYFLDGRSLDAARTFERVTTRKEGNPFIYAMLAAIYAEDGRDDDARTAAAEVHRLNPLFDTARFGSLFKNAADRDRLANALKRTGL